MLMNIVKCSVNACDACGCCHTTNSAKEEKINLKEEGKKKEEKRGPEKQFRLFMLCIPLQRYTYNNNIFDFVPLRTSSNAITFLIVSFCFLLFILRIQLEIFTMTTIEYSNAISNFLPYTYAYSSLGTFICIGKKDLMRFIFRRTLCMIARCVCMCIGVQCSNENISFTLVWVLYIWQQQDKNTASRRIDFVLLWMFNVLFLSLSLSLRFSDAFHKCNESAVNVHETICVLGFVVWQKRKQNDSNSENIRDY